MGTIETWMTGKGSTPLCSSSSQSLAHRVMIIDLFLSCSSLDRDRDTGKERERERETMVGTGPLGCGLGLVEWSGHD